MVLVASMVTTVVVWRDLRARGLDRPIKVLALTTADPAGQGARAEAERKAKSARPSLSELMKRGNSSTPPPAERRLEGPALIAEIERTTPLSSAQRARITNTLALAASVQKGIDTMADPDARMDLQRRLDDQVRTRLQMILPGETLAVLDDLDTSSGANRALPP